MVDESDLSVDVTQAPLSLVIESQIVLGVFVGESRDKVGACTDYPDIR
jgi:hypothetical protein